MRAQLFRCTLMFVLAVSAITGVFQPAVDLQAQPPQPPAPQQVSLSPEGDKIGIYVSDSDGGQRKLVIRVDMSFNHPLFSDFVSLSPDGRQVLYVTADNTALLNAGVWIAQVDGSGARRIAQFPEGFWTVAPVWSPDGKRIAYVKKLPGSTPDEGLQLWMMNDDGSHQTLVTQEGEFRPALFDRIPHRVIRWSAEGTRLEFTSRWSSPPYVFSIDLDTRSITRSETAKEPQLVTLSSDRGATALPCAVPTFNQQNYGNNMRTCNLPISLAGSALTSAAMVLKYYGVNTSPSALNSCLGDRACPLCWAPVASDCSDSKVSSAGFRWGFSYDTIDQDLAAGKPVIVWVSNSAWWLSHFVVVTGGGGQTPGGYTINDPADGSSYKTLAYYVNAGWNLSEINRYSGAPGCLDPDGGLISYGQTKYGTISPAGDYDDYYFNATAGDVVEIRQNKNGSTLDSFVELYGPSSYFAWDDDSGGSLNSFLRRTLPYSGQYRIRARGYGTSTGAYALSLIKAPSCVGDCEGDPRWIAFGQTLNGTINPSNDQDTYYFNGTAGRVISIRMNRTGGSLDSYLELWSPSGAFLKANDDGGGSLNSWLVHTLPSNGTYRIVARSYNNASSGTCSIKLESVTGAGANLALGKPVWVSSVAYAGVEGWRATDGNMGTRWSSAFSDPQQIYVDLGQNRTFNQVVLKWATGYGRRFGVYYWTGSQWQNVYWTDYGPGGTNTINFSPVTARYVTMYGIERGASFGYSLWEFEVYDTTATTVPDVPPDDPDKVDTGSVAPLPPTEGSKDVLTAGNGEYGQEETPLAGGDPATLTEQVTTAQTVAAFIRSPSELDSLYTDVGYIRFEGEASSRALSGTTAITPSITAYSWRSNRNGALGSEALFTRPVTSLLPGLHTIFFKAQNELGTWSGEVTTTLRVEWPHQVFLPAIVK